MNIDFTDANQVEEYQAHHARTLEEIAADLGLVVVYPKPNELFVDIDTDEQYEQFLKTLYYSGSVIHTGQWDETVSSSGLPHRHIKVGLEETVQLTNVERIGLELVFGGDPKRALMCLKSMFAGRETPSVFFEKP